MCRLYGVVLGANKHSNHGNGGGMLDSGFCVANSTWTHPLPLEHSKYVKKGSFLKLIVLQF